MKINVRKDKNSLGCFQLSDQVGSTNTVDFIFQRKNDNGTSNSTQQFPEAEQDLPKLINNESPETHKHKPLKDDIDSNCSTPFVSAPSSPSLGSHPLNGFFYSAPASPLHSALTLNSLSLSQPSSPSSLENNFKPLSSDFEFSSRFGSSGPSFDGSMSTADELFLNGKIRPLTPLPYFEQPQVLDPFLNVENEKDTYFELVTGRDLRLCDRSLHKRTRSVSPLTFVPFDDWNETQKLESNDFCSVLKQSKTEEGSYSQSMESNPPASASSSSSSSLGGINSRRLVFRSRSEGSNQNKFWSTVAFTYKGKKPMNQSLHCSVSKEKKSRNQFNGDTDPDNRKTVAENSVNGSENGISPHEEHYSENRVQAEELKKKKKKKMVLPNKQGFVGCLGFTSKSFGLMNRFTRALDPLSTE